MPTTAEIGCHLSQPAHPSWQAAMSAVLMRGPGWSRHSLAAGGARCAASCTSFSTSRSPRSAQHHAKRHGLPELFWHRVRLLRGRQAAEAEAAGGQEQRRSRGQDSLSTCCNVAGRPLGVQGRVERKLRGVVKHLRMASTKVLEKVVEQKEGPRRRPLLQMQLVTSPAARLRCCHCPRRTTATGHALLASIRSPLRAAVSVCGASRHAGLSCWLRCHSESHECCRGRSWSARSRCKLQWVGSSHLAILVTNLALVQTSRD